MSFLQLVILLAVSSTCVLGKVDILNLANCDAAADYPIKLTAKLKNADGMHVVEEASISSTISLGNNILDVADVYEFENGKYEHLITIREPLCDAVRKYMGEFMHDIQSAAGIEPGSCPVPPGDYKLSNHALDFEKFKFKKLPAGKYKVMVNLINTENNATLNCHFVEFKLEK